MHKDIERIVLSQKEIENIVNTLAKSIEKDYNNRDFIAIGLLKGSQIFMADLMRRVNLDFKIDFMAVSSYGCSTVSSGNVNIKLDTSLSLEGKDVLVIEDIIDSGNTLCYIKKHLLSKGADSVKICTLLDKPSRRTADIKADYIGYTIPDEFIVGYGMDYNERYRNLPYIGVLKSEIFT